MPKAQLDTDLGTTLLESIDETVIILLSRGVLDALYAHLQSKYHVSRNEVPHNLEPLLVTLEKIFGIASSQTISKAIAKRFYSKLGVEFKGNPGGTLIDFVEDAKMKLQNSSSK